jgi:hypothetical protein
LTLDIPPSLHVQPLMYDSPQSPATEHCFTEGVDKFAIVVVVVSTVVWLVVVTDNVVVADAKEDVVVLKVVVVTSGSVEAVPDCVSSMSQIPFLFSSMQHSPPAQVLELISNVDVVEIAVAVVEVWFFCPSFGIPGILVQQEQKIIPIIRTAK